MEVDVFISHHTQSSLKTVEAICNSLENQKIRCWYAPRDTIGTYASSISDAISKCKIFVLILNKESSYSQDVLNEINLAFERMRRTKKLVLFHFILQVKI